MLRYFHMGSGCGAVGRAVASDTRGPGSNPVIGNFYLLLTVWRNYENKEKEAGNGPFFKIFLNIGRIGYWTCRDG